MIHCNWSCVCVCVCRWAYMLTCWPLLSNQSFYRQIAGCRRGWVIGRWWKGVNYQQNSYLTATGMHSTMHLMHPNLLSDNYYMSLYIHTLYMYVYVCAFVSVCQCKWCTCAAAACKMSHTAKHYNTQEQHLLPVCSAQRSQRQHTPQKNRRARQPDARESWG